MRKSVILYYPKIRYFPEYKFFWTPLSLLAISRLLKNNYEIIIIDGNIEKDYSKVIEDNLPHCVCVGISTMTGGGQILDAIKFAQIIKNINKNIPIVWGGPHPASLPNECIKHNLIDVVVRGQGEITFKEVVNSLAEKGPLDKISGVTYKIDGKIIHNIDRPIFDINALPNMPWELVEVENYIRNDVTVNTRTINFVSSYGCPYNCRFCYEVVAYKRRWTGLKAESILNELSALIDKYNINGVKFYDANFFVNPPRIKEFCEGIIKRELKIKWAASAHPRDLIRLKNDFSLIKKSGCTRILIGAESGSPEILKFIDKKVTVEEILEVARLCHEFQIIGSFTFIVGFPINVDEEVEKTSNLIAIIRRDYPEHEIRVHLWAPYPGTELYPIALKKGFKPPKTLEEWANYEYYKPQTPWINERLIKIMEYTFQWNLKSGGTQL